MFPTNDIDLVFPCSMRRYGSTAGLKCIGDGSHAYDVIERKDVNCPCKYYTGTDDDGKPCKVECNKVGFLFVILYKISMSGVYQVRTQSVNSVTDVMSGFDYIENLLKRPFSGIPLVLKREKIETHHDQKRQVHHTMKLFLPDGFNIDAANKLITDSKRIYDTNFMLPEPKDENPTLDKPDVIEAEGIKDEEKDSKKESEKQKEPSKDDDGDKKSRPDLWNQTQEDINMVERDEDKIKTIPLQEVAKMVNKMFKAQDVSQARRIEIMQKVSPSAKKMGDLSRHSMMLLYYKVKHLKI